MLLGFALSLACVTLIGITLVLLHREGYRSVTCTDYVGANQIIWTFGNSSSVATLSTTDRPVLPIMCWIWIDGLLHSSNTVIFAQPRQMVDDFGIGIGCVWFALILFWFVVETYCIDKEKTSGGVWAEDITPSIGQSLLPLNYFRFKTHR